MAVIHSASIFWKTLRSISVKEIYNEAHEPFSMAIVGAPEKRAQFVNRLFPGVKLEEADLMIRQFNSTKEEDGFPQENDSFEIIVDTDGVANRENPALKVIRLPDIGSPEQVMKRILDEHNNLALSLARRFPGFRDMVTDRIIRETAGANANFAMINAIPGVLPILIPLLPATAIGDMFLITKNQGMMLFRLAAAYDLPLDVRSRSHELAPLLGNAFGWRAIAREVVAVAPGGVGLAARGAISYAGTMALGKALVLFYKTGKEPSVAQINRYYHSLYDDAKRIMANLLISK